MRLIDVIAHLDEYRDELTIYSRPQRTPQSEAVVLAEPDDGSTRAATAGDLHYVLEVCIAKEVIDVWQKWRGRAPTPDEACRAVLHYADHDAYEPLGPAEGNGSLDADEPDAFSLRAERVCGRWSRGCNWS